MKYWRKESRSKESQGSKSNRENLSNYRNKNRRNQFLQTDRRNRKIDAKRRTKRKWVPKKKNGGDANMKEKANVQKKIQVVKCCENIVQDNMTFKMQGRKYQETLNN